MQVTFSSKNIQLTSGFKEFVERKLSKLSRFASKGLSNVQVLFDVDRHRRGADADSIVEMTGSMNHKTVVVKESGKTFYKAFFLALAKMKRKVEREKEKNTW